MSNDLIVKVNKLFENIGRSNGTAPKDSQDATNNVQHEYAVATFGESYWKKRREKAKDALLRAVSTESNDKLDNALKDVEKTGTGKNVQIIDGENFDTVVEIKNGAQYVDTTVLGINLMKDYKLTHDQVAQLMEKSTKRRAPAQSVKTVEK